MPLTPRSRSTNLKIRSFNSRFQGLVRSLVIYPAVAKDSLVIRVIRTISRIKLGPMKNR